MESNLNGLIKICWITQCQKGIEISILSYFSLNPKYNIAILKTGFNVAISKYSHIFIVILTH